MFTLTGAAIWPLVSVGSTIAGMPCESGAYQVSEFGDGYVGLIVVGYRLSTERPSEYGISLIPYPARTTNVSDNRYANPSRGENSFLGMDTPQLSATSPEPQTST